MKLKKNVALVMIAAAMLASVSARADNPSTGNVGLNTTGASAATGLEQGFVPKKGGIFSEQDKEDDPTRGYKEEWAQQGCTKEAWVELKTQYDKNMRMSIAQSAKTDQRIMDVIKNPNQMNIEGFSMLGCDLNDSLKTIQSVTNTVREFMEAIGSGNPLDGVKATLEKKARNLIQGITKKVEEELQQLGRQLGCKAINAAASDIDKFLTKKAGKEYGELNKSAIGMSQEIARINQEYIDAAKNGADNIYRKIGNDGN